MAPAMTLAEARKKQGIVPKRHWKREQRRMPARTDVGQSGPPMRMPTLARVMPLTMRRFLMPCIKGVCTPQIWSTFLFLDMHSPMPFCCIAHAESFRMIPTKQLTTIPTENH